MTKKIDDLVDLLQDYQTAIEIRKLVGKKGYVEALSISNEDNDYYEAVTITPKVAKGILDNLIEEYETQLIEFGVDVN